MKCAVCGRAGYRYGKALHHVDQRVKHEFVQTSKCRFCGGLIEAFDGDHEGAVRMHVLSERHRRVMRDAGVKPKPSPAYAEPERTEFGGFVGPMQKLVGPCVCQGCRENVDVVRYVGRIFSVHPDGSLVCAASV